MKMTAKNSTHLLMCRHAIGLNGYNYEMQCHVLGKTQSGRLKILVFGDRNWKYSDHISRIRYVEQDKVLKKMKGGKW